ncbi:hypothetical protein EJ063_05485 [Vibrio aquaticus]|uniref:Uncharacterized protein n=1 Tax=Vibrio aquaticus TaxID=2496559 RepID=A0A3S0N8A8_9VIBR|nr:hypothetical protein [Vibrio aquaticus]RTZ18239.1 hypothetical protein EJ063_05485 [Vibrio aquaticus]
MTKLEAQLKAIQADSIPSVANDGKNWQLLCDKHSDFYARVLSNKPDIKPINHLLGLLTKLHIEETSSVTSYAESASAMRQLIDEKVGPEHSHKFDELGSQQLSLVTHLWVYLQGYLRMDFSLANDHAFNTAELLSPMLQSPTHELRAQFLESYYLGVERSPIQEKSESKVMALIKRLFG